MRPTDIKSFSRNEINIRTFYYNYCINFFCFEINTQKKQAKLKKTRSRPGFSNSEFKGPKINIYTYMSRGAQIRPFTTPTYGCDLRLDAYNNLRSWFHLRAEYSIFEYAFSVYKSLYSF